MRSKLSFPVLAAAVAAACTVTVLQAQGSLGPRFLTDDPIRVDADTVVDAEPQPDRLGGYADFVLTRSWEQGTSGPFRP